MILLSDVVAVVLQVISDSGSKGTEDEVDEPVGLQLSEFAAHM